MGPLMFSPFFFLLNFKWKKERCTDGRVGGGGNRKSYCMPALVMTRWQIKGGPPGGGGGCLKVEGQKGRAANGNGMGRQQLLLGFPFVFLISFL